MTPGLTVVLPTHDRAHQVTARIEALLGADDPPDQVVVVADGCTDNTLDRLAECAAGPLGERLEVVTTEGLGPATARNLGAARARGRWIAFLDDDDLPEPRWVPVWRELAAAHPESEYLSVPYVVREGGTDHPRGVPLLGPAFSGAHACYMPGTYAIRSDRFAATGGFLDGLRYLECTELAMRLFADLRSRPRSMAAGSEATIVRVGRPVGQRAAVRPEVLVPSTRRAHETMAPHLARDPDLWAKGLGALGVAEIRSGDHRAGAASLRRAAQLAPSMQTLGRAAIATMPPLRRLAWLRSPP